MANTASAKKRVRVTERRTAVNGARISRIRTYIKKVEAALAAGDTTGAKAAFAAAEPEIMRGVSAGVLHRNTAARKVSRLAQRVNALAAPQT